MKNVTVTLVTHEGGDTKSAVLSGAVGDLGNDKVDQFFISNLRAVLNEIDPPTATGQNGCGIVRDNITQVYDYVAEAKRNTLHHLLLSQAGGDLGRISAEQVAGLVNKAYEELERPPVEDACEERSRAKAQQNMIIAINTLCNDFGWPVGESRTDWLRTQLTRLKDLTEPNLDNADFSDALMWLHGDKRVARHGWNGAGQSVSILRATGHTHFGTVQKDCFGLNSADGWVQPGWVPSTGDLMATDWYVVE